MHYFNEEKEVAKSILDKNGNEYLFEKNTKLVLLGEDGGVKKRVIEEIFKNLGLSKDAFTKSNLKQGLKNS